MKITVDIYTHKHWDVTVVYLTCSYMGADNDEMVHMVLMLNTIKLMFTTPPKTYRRFVTCNHYVKDILYVVINKALYGILKISLLFYNII